jgi:peroxiredoxin
MNTLSLELKGTRRCALQSEKLGCSSGFDGGDRALRGPRPRAAGGTNGTTVLDQAKCVPRLNGAVKAQHAIPTHFGFRVQALVAGLLGMIAFNSLALAGPVKVGDTFPELASFGLEGTQPDLKGKVVLLDFWASWCAPCKKSFPVMKELHEKFGSRGFLVLAVSVDEQASAMQSFLKKEPQAFAILRDAKGRLAEAVGVEKMPTSFLIGADGKIVAIHSGFDGEPTRKKYLAEIEANLKSAGK